MSPALVAHGGLGGAVVESLLVVSIAVVFVVVWLRERRPRSPDDERPEPPEA